MTNEKYLELLRAHIKKKYQTQAKAGEAWGISRVAVSRMLNGSLRPNQVVLDDTGYDMSKKSILVFNKRVNHEV